MKKIICLIFAILFYILGFIGILLPVIPQIPFLLLGTLFLCMGFKNIKQQIKKSKLYNKNLKKHVKKSKFLSSILEEEN